jgi:hypothetical protein
VTTGEAPFTDTSTTEELQQIPAMITVTEVSVATDARDKLLAAIGQEAQYLADKYAGQASPALEALARAYALVTSGSAVVAAGTRVAARSGGERSLDIQVPNYKIDDVIQAAQ